MTIIHGDVRTRRVTINGEALDPGPSQAITNHSPDGFGWGYGAFGPSQLALAIMLRFVPEQEARRHYQAFKWEVLAPLDPHDDLRINVADVRSWCEARKLTLLEDAPA